jgi:hypothetical protein
MMPLYVSSSFNLELSDVYLSSEIDALVTCLLKTVARSTVQMWRPSGVSLESIGNVSNVALVDTHLSWMKTEVPGGGWFGYVRFRCEWLVL